MLAETTFPTQIPMTKMFRQSSSLALPLALFLCAVLLGGKSAQPAEDAPIDATRQVVFEVRGLA
jgi:hypothetical protein